jgi:hypothetical protein
MVPYSPSKVTVSIKRNHSHYSSYGTGFRIL